MVTADHKVLNKRHCIADLQWSCKTWRRNGFKVIHPRPNELKRRREISEKSYVQKNTQDPLKLFYSLEFMKACEELNWNHRRSTPRRSETNGVAERAVRRVIEGTSSVLVQSGLHERWWAEAMQRYCCLRKVQDLLWVARRLMKDGS